MITLNVIILKNLPYWQRPDIQAQLVIIFCHFNNLDHKKLILYSARQLVIAKMLKMKNDALSKNLENSFKEYNLA